VADAAAVVGMPLLDHVIVARRRVGFVNHHATSDSRDPGA
jgi:hypothetical protein